MFAELVLYTGGGGVKEGKERGGKEKEKRGDGVKKAKERGRRRRGTKGGENKAWGKGRGKEKRKSGGEGSREKEDRGRKEGGSELKLSPPFPVHDTVTIPGLLSILSTATR